MMSDHAIVVMPGDGIGKIVLPEALRVLDAVGFQADYVQAEVGWDCWIRQGDALPQRTIELLEKHNLGLFGAITSKPKKAAEAELSPALRGKGCVYYSPIVKMRQLFDLDICIRPCRSFPGNPLNFIRQKAATGGRAEKAATGGRADPGGPRDRRSPVYDDAVEEPKIDAVIFRQNTEGLYSGVEWTNPPKAVQEALETHPQMKHFAGVDSRDLAVSCRILSRPACGRIIRAAFDYARRFGYPLVTICEKPNVLRETSGMMEEEARKIAAEYGGIALRSTNIDAQMMWLTKNPEDYGVVVASNMFGDIISDGFAGLVGGLGFAASANLGPEVAVFEPTHGSAPKYAALSPPIVNPIAMILTTAMMLDHLDLSADADRIRTAIAQVVAEGKTRTYDMLRLPGGPEVTQQGAASTTQMTDAIIANVRERA
jgi:3-isopropylmalate dehydrogenase